MTQFALPEDIRLLIEGDVSGQIAIGGYVIQVNSVYGDVVNAAEAELRAKIQPVSPPVYMRPRRFPGFLDRQTEVTRLEAALRSAMPAEICGQAGIGKTSLLRHIAYAPLGDLFPDGMVYFSAWHQSVTDVLQELFDAFYECPTHYKPTDTEIRQALQDKQILVLLDDIALPREQAETLLSLLPSCTFVLTSSTRHLWNDGCALALRGLPLEDGLTLMVRELGRPLTPAERPDAQALHAALDGHPLRILQQTALVHEHGLTLAEVVRHAQSQEEADTHVLAYLSKPEQQVVATMASLGGFCPHADHVRQLSGVADAQTILDALARRGVVQGEATRYSLSEGLVKRLQDAANLTPLTARAMTYFTTWAAHLKNAPDQLVEEANVLMHLLAWGIDRGYWSEVIRLGRALEGALALERRWGAWAQVLQWILIAAQVLGDPATHAWALHQDGTRLLCLGEKRAARTMLVKALQRRESLGDQTGAATTRHNLRFLLSPPGPRKQEPSQTPSPLFRLRPTVYHLLPIGAIGLLAALLLALAGLASSNLFSPPSLTPTLFMTPTSFVPPTSDATPTETRTPTPTPDPPPSPTATPTPWPSSPINTPISPLPTAILPMSM